MQINEPIIKLLHRLWKHIGRRRRIQFALLVVLMICASFAEVVSIGAVLPFLGVLVSPERVFEHHAAQPLIHILGITEPKQILLPITIAFGSAVLIAGSMRLLLMWASTRLTFSAGADISMSIYRRTLFQPYLVHVSRNSSSVINGISGKANAAMNGTILPVLNLISSTVMLIFILITLLSVDPVIALMAFGGFGLIYAAIIRFTRAKMRINSQHISRESTQVLKSLQEGLGGIRDVLIDGTQEIYCRIFRNADQMLRTAVGSSSFISSSPRFAMEALGMLLIAMLAYFLAQQADGISKAIPVLGVLALGAQRMLPVLQMAYGSWTSIANNQASLQDTLELLDQSLPAYATQPVAIPLPFLKSIYLNRISFRYSPQTPYVIKNLELSIVKGSRVGFIGTTGSGKSSLLDIVMGLLHPDEGTLEIDGQPITIANQRNWQTHIAHVPQVIFLADSSIEENIAFGVPVEKIDHERVSAAAKQAQIADIIESWPDQYRTFVGERGVRLSGGQRQRIGIARALYKQADVIIFDEATSALDNVTEEAVMQAIEGLGVDLTVLIIAHRLTTLRNCTQIVELGDGKVKKIGSYHDVVEKS